MEERQAHLNHNPGTEKGHTMNIYLTDSDEEAFVEFIKDHDELHDKTRHLNAMRHHNRVFNYKPQCSFPAFNSTLELI